MSYKLVPPEDFTPEHKQHIESIKNAFKTLFSEKEVIFAVRDIHSRNVLVSDYDAKLVGLSRGEDIEGLFDSELPCKVAEFAQDFIDEEKKLLSCQNHHKEKSMLNMLEYATGLETFVSHKYQIVHHASQSILGTQGIAHKTDLSFFFELMPNYLTEFGKVGNLEKVDGKLKIGDVHLTEYEQEVCFLVTMNFSYKQIANFMNKYRPRATERKQDTMYKCRERLCEKLNLDRWNFRDGLISMNFHRKIPESFFYRLIGNRSLAS